jgi:hypothetical protein
MNYKEEITKLIMASYDQGVKDAQQEALVALEKMVAIVRADERDRAMRENAYVQAEREACAKACEDVHAGKYEAPEFWREGVAYTCAAAIRARSQA